MFEPLGTGPSPGAVEPAGLINTLRYCSSFCKGRIWYATIKAVLRGLGLPGEGAMIHRGTAAGSTTVVGSRCCIMANAHVDHNCTVGDEVTLVNGALLSGYISVAAKAIVSGHAAVDQLVCTGELALVGGLVIIPQDILPSMMPDHHGRCVGPHSIGLGRIVLSVQDREVINDALRILYRSGLPQKEAIAVLAASSIAQS